MLKVEKHTHDRETPGSTKKDTYRTQRNKNITLENTK